MDNNKVRRPVRPTDFLVVFAGFVHNIAQVFDVLTGELMDLAIYHAKRTSEVEQVWEEFTNDLETIEEDTDGR